jgi:hypothetical protein
LACLWPEQFPDGIETVGLAWTKPSDLALFVWLYCLVCWFVQDAFKICVVKLMHEFNVFGINDSSLEAMAKEAEKGVAMIKYSSNKEETHRRTTTAQSSQDTDGGQASGKSASTIVYSPVPSSGCGALAAAVVI